MYKKAETKRHESKLLLPEGGRWFPKEEPSTALEGGPEKILWVRLARGAGEEQGGRIAQNELLWVLKRVNGGLDLCHRQREHLR